MKKLKLGDIITEEGYFYTSKEHKKNLKRIEVINNIEAICAPNKNNIVKNK